MARPPSSSAPPPARGHRVPIVPNPKSAPASSATPARRQSCDRCHGQKLRCTRTSNNQTGACNRCLRQGAQCVYSASLPKGRPSMYRLAQVSPSAAADVVASVDAPAVPGPIPSPLNAREMLVASGVPRHLDGAGHPVTPGEHSAASATGNRATTAMEVTRRESEVAGPRRAGLVDASSDDSSMWIWDEGLVHWDDMQLDDGGVDEQRHQHETAPVLHHLGANHEFERAMGAEFLLEGTCSQELIDWPKTAAPARHGDDGDVRTPDHASVYATPDETLSFQRGSHERWARGRDMRLDTRAAAHGSATTSASDQSGPVAEIAQLSQLSTRLYPLQQSAVVLADHAKSPDCGQRLLIDDAAIKSVAAWLVHGASETFAETESQDWAFRLDPRLRDFTTTSTANSKFGEALHETFWVSYRLLVILDGLPSMTASANMGNPPTPPCSAQSTSTGSPTEVSGNLNNMDTGKHSSHSSQHHSHHSHHRRWPSSSLQNHSAGSTVVRHLVSACHTMLLDIYGPLLDVLEHDAGVLELARGKSNSNSITSGSGLAVQTGASPSSMSHGSAVMRKDPESEPAEGTTKAAAAAAAPAAATPAAGAAVLGEMRLTMVVHLCSYLIEREQRAVNLFLFPEQQAWLHQRQLHTKSRPWSAPNSVSGCGGRQELMSSSHELGMEVQDRILRLRQKLQYKLTY